MNYQLAYENLITKHGSWKKPVGAYVERHRKLPGYLGGRYIEGNAFYMSARGHYLAHLLWAKMTNHQKAWRAICGMASRLKMKRARMYEAARVIAAEHQSRMTSGSSNPMYGKKHTKDAVARMTRLGVPVSDAAKHNMSLGQTGRTHTEEVKRKISAANKGKVMSDESRVLMSKAKKGVPLKPAHAAKVKLTLSVCGKTTSAQRWRCDVCSFESTPAGLGTHQKYTKHSGKIKLC